MIDPEKETILTLTQARARIAKLRGGQRADLSTLHRWMRKGRRGICLESFLCGGRRMTSAEAIQRFCDRLTEAADGDRPAEVAPHVLTITRKEQIAAAGNRLARSKPGFRTARK